MFSGQSSNLDKAAQQLEKPDVPDDVEINASDKGVEVTFRRTVSFEQGSIEISGESCQGDEKMFRSFDAKWHRNSGQLWHRCKQLFPSNWEMSVARASAIAGFSSKQDCSWENAGGWLWDATFQRWYRLQKSFEPKGGNICFQKNRHDDCVSSPNWNV